MKHLTIFSLSLVLLTVLSYRFSWNIADVAVAATCLESGTFESGVKKVHLIELYTSEGCSSCPPAEKWLNSLYKDKNLYKTFIPMAFHVDYWNYLGHKDPLSKKEFSKRQRLYASEWNSRSVYTPGLVQDGKEWRSLLRKTPSSLGKEVGNLKVDPINDKKFKVSFTGEGGGSIYGAYLLHGLEHNIRRGENRGKTLKHNFVVAHLVTKPLIKNSSTIEFDLENLPKHKDKSVVFWVSSQSSLVPLQAVGRCLSAHSRK